MINKEKCNAWSEMLIAVTKMAKELTDEEFEYIEAQFQIACGKLKIEKLEAKDEV